MKDPDKESISKQPPCVKVPPRRIRLYCDVLASIDIDYMGHKICTNITCVELSSYVLQSSDKIPNTRTCVFFLSLPEPRKNTSLLSFISESVMAGL
jgi:hypothetical protein